MYGAKARREEEREREWKRDGKQVKRGKFQAMYFIFHVAKKKNGKKNELTQKPNIWLRSIGFDAAPNTQCYLIMT